MIPFEALSKIGFGSQYSTIDEPSHYEGICEAIHQGCNLIDTSVTYYQGGTEKLIGKVLQQYDRDKLFIITKAGHAFGSNIDLMNGLIQKGMNEYVILGDNFKFSIHPDFLDAEINISLQRMGIEQIDCFLLHNPERYFKGGGANQEIYYKRIEKAFAYLEEQVDKGVLRYYGVSSNTLPYSTERMDTTSLPKLMALANKVSTSHHFKVIQFPYNLYENQATTELHDGKNNMLSIAKKHALLTLANRPLNALLDGNYILLASFEDQIGDLNLEKDQQVIEAGIELIQGQLKKIGRSEQAIEFPMVKSLVNNWSTFNKTSDVKQMFENELALFLDALYQGAIPQSCLEKFGAIQHIAERYAMKNMTSFANKVKAQFFEATDAQSLQYLVCQHYLDKGIDHVLVSMELKRYVNQLQGLFNY